jgi:hypothetical protein
MDLTQIKTEKKQLEVSLFNYIHKKVEAFTEKTGVSPGFIHVDMVSCSVMGDNPNDERRVVDVRVNIEL